MSRDDFPTWPHFDEDEIHASFRVLQSTKVNYWTGSEGKQFEKEFADFIGCKHAIAVANGSVALQVALYGLGIGHGDDVVVTARTFVASVSSIVLSGALPVFADVDPDSQNITAETIESVITPRTRAIICVHLAGWPCEMDDILALANKRNIPVIEDCAQAHGAKYKGQSVGSFGDVAAWSFCQDKIMTTAGEGGMVTTNNTGAHRRMWSYKDHGKDYDKVHSPKQSEGFTWLHDTVGTNYRMTEIQSAIGRLQLLKLPKWHDARLNNAKQIWHVAGGFPLFRVPDVPSHSEHAAYKCYVFLNLDKLKAGWNQNRVISKINDMGVPCFHGSCSEVYLEKAFKNSSNLPENRLESCRLLGDTSLMFLVHPTLTQREINLTCKVIADVAEMASQQSSRRLRSVTTVD